MKNIHVAAAVILDDHKVFVARRKDAGELALKWEFPGGKLEKGESGEQAIIREIREELSITVAVQRHFLQVSHQYTSFFLTMDAYLCTIEEGTITLSEHVNCKWVNASELLSLDWAAADIPIARQLKKLMEASR
ncbi:MAG: (deoxy)nucleoside triphosphate pyrophosphohydrolase [Sphaerochaetaceae bacterium]|nr:(deoxy)nucleoside triphosphate pyrophosphohydrolase [Sphaerochaetaceae bacterium]